MAFNREPNNLRLDRSAGLSGGLKAPLLQGVHNMPSFHSFDVKAEEPGASVRERFLRDAPKDSIVGLINFLQGLAGGRYNGVVSYLGGAVKAEGTLTLDTVVATNTASINGVQFTAIASGATGNQFNVGASDAATAVNLAAAINGSASALVNQHVVAEADGDVVTVTAKRAGASGNAITLTGSTNITASGARLEDGSDGQALTYEYGLAE